VGFVAQDAPVYSGLTVADHLRLGAHLNPRWDAPLARRRLAEAGVASGQKAGRLSGGQRARLALTLASAKRPELLVLDEPAGALDPLARNEFLQNLRESIAELGATAVLSSHLLSDVERVCDHLIVLGNGRVQVAGDVRDLLASHYRVDAVPAGAELVVAGSGGAIVRASSRPPGARSVSLEDIALAYLTRAAGAVR
jgi:ABC-2 type transport system ATP-binding protein